MHHFVEGRRDQAGQTDHLRILTACCLENLLAGHHDAEIDHLEVVALEHDANDILADVMHVTLDRRENDLAIRADLASLFFFDERHEMTDGLLHYARRLDHLRQKHLALTKQVADNIHAGHQWPLDDIERLLCATSCLLGISNNIFVDTVDERVFQALFDSQLAPT